MKNTLPSTLRPSLNAHLLEQANVPDALRHLIVDISRGCKYISYAIQTTEAGLAGKVNQFGEEQQKLDVVSDGIVCTFLAESHLVRSYVSEEQREIVELEPTAPYSVAFDPLDGSSLIEANFAIGSIFGIYEGDVLGQKPSAQVAALYVLYGPRTLLVYSTGQGVHMFILNDIGEYILLESHLGVADDAKNYSPGNLRALEDNDAYKRILHRWLDTQLTLRYSGCMVADIHHILAKGQGVFTNVGGSKYPEGKLRLAFECGPFAYIIEQAGGAASNGYGRIVDTVIKHIDQRTPIIIGSKHEVERIVQEIGERKRT
ncbi:MAG: class 1 fructose-bisphosphatase [Candidatus Peribacteraceae bacterium]